MATARLYNLARMTTATTGTGTVTLGSAVTGFLSFASAGVADGATVTYAIKDGNNSEIGRGVYTSSGTTLTRATILNSTNSNNALNLTGSAEVFISPAAQDILMQDNTTFRNNIISGNFDFWQRGTSTTTAGYLADRWRTNATGSTFTTSRQSFTVGQTDVPNNPTYWSRTAVTSSAGASNLCNYQQRIESVATLAGQLVTVSFYAKADTSKNIAVELIQNFGTGGSPSSEVTGIGVTTCALTTSWQKFTLTATLTSVSGKTFGSNNNSYVGINFWFDAGSTFNSRTNSLGQQSGTFDIAQVQLEAGSVATPFEDRPLGVELALCQRYYEVGGTTNIFSGEVTSGTIYYHSVRFCALKKAVPSITTTHGGANGFDTSDPVLSTITSADGFIVQKTATGTGSNGYYYYSWTASAEL